MKKIVLFLFIFSCFYFCNTVYAHPPAKIEISYNKEEKIVSAVITHTVSNVQKHYIKKVDVSLNGIEIINQKIKRQDKNVTQKVLYYIPEARKGDVVSIKAYCSRSGKLTKEIKID